MLPTVIQKRSLQMIRRFRRASVTPSAADSRNQKPQLELLDARIAPGDALAGMLAGASLFGAELFDLAGLGSSSSSQIPSLFSNDAAGIAVQTVEAEQTTAAAVVETQLTSSTPQHDEADATGNPAFHIPDSTRNAPVFLNEIRLDQTGADNDEYFELVGSPGESLSSLTDVVIGDGLGGSGVNEAVELLAGSNIGADAILFGADPLIFENTDTRLEKNPLTSTPTQPTPKPYEPPAYFHRMFVTDTSYNVGVGQFVGANARNFADYECTFAAWNAGFLSDWNGTDLVYTAFMSHSGLDVPEARDRIDLQGEVQNTLFQVVWKDPSNYLVDVPLNTWGKTEFGADVPSNALFTGSDEAGGQSSDCAQWTDPNAAGQHGLLLNLTFGGNSLGCQVSGHFICFGPPEKLP
jgi:hypothetical protein